MSGVPLEIERKLVIDEPDREALSAAAVSESDIVQTYLLTTEWDAERVRQRVVRDADGDRVQLTHTCKQSVSRGVAEELETEVDPATYDRLLARADPARVPIEKTRWVVPWGGLTLEIDGFRAPAGLWLLEVELADAASLHDALDLPPWVRVVAEVTGDPAYSNVALALRAAQT